MAQTTEPLCPKCDRPALSDGSCNYCLLQLGKSDRQSAVAQAALDLPTPEQLQRSFPQLEITRLIGVGGMGAIYHARQRSLDRDVALKIISRSVADDPAFEERFTREAKTLARLSHPNIVTVYDFGSTDDGLVYLLMEFVDGVNLREAMDAGGIRSHEAVQIVSEMCAALQFAHDRGVVHRDIKPENVLLNEEGIVKVADFGLAKLLSDSPANLTLTNTRQVMGTLRYMAPEQFENPSSVDHRADVYSLGVVFYELLTGQVPVGRFDVPSRVNATLNPRLDEIVMRTLDRKPPNRYQRVGEIASDLSSMESDSSCASSTPPAFTTPGATISVPFEVDGNFVVSVGNIKLEANCLDVGYRTRDNIFHVFKSAPRSVRIPLNEIAKLEWRPGAFNSTIAIVPKSISFAEQLPNADNGQSLLRVGYADTQNAAKLVWEASQREPALRGSSSTSSVTQRIALAEPQRVSRTRITLGVLYFVSVALNILGMVLALVVLSGQNRTPQTVTTMVLIPVFTVATIVMQIIGGIFCFSPYTRRMPLAAATISMLPLAAGWPLAFCVGAWTWWSLGRDPDDKSQERGIPLIGGLLGAANSRMQTTMMYLREARWSKLVAIANIVALVPIVLIFIGYQAGYYPTTLHFRVVDNESTWGDEVQRVESRLQRVSGHSTVTASTDGFSGGKSVDVYCMKRHELDVQRALAISGSVQWAWVIAPSEDSADPSATNLRLNVGGTISSEAIKLASSIELADQPTPFESSGLKSIAGAGKQLTLQWTPDGRQRVDESKPGTKVIGLALIVEDLVEGFASLGDISNRGATFSMAKDSSFELEAIEAAIRGPELKRPLELLNR